MAQESHAILIIKPSTRALSLLLVVPPRRWPDNCTEPAQTPRSSRGLEGGLATDVGPRFTIAKGNLPCESHRRRKSCACSGILECQSKSRHGRADFRHRGLVACNSSCLDLRVAGVLRMASRVSLDQPHQGEGRIRMQKLPGQFKKFPLASAGEKSRQEALIEAEFQATLHLPGGRSLDCWIGNIASANRDNGRSRARRDKPSPEPMG